MAASAQDHSGLEVLPYDECLLLLAQTPVGRVAFISDGELVILPVNHAMDGGSIVFRTAAGTKLRAAESAAVVGFEVDGFEPGLREGWSVVVSGTAELVLEDAELHRLESCGRRSQRPSLASRSTASSLDCARAGAWWCREPPSWCSRTRSCTGWRATGCGRGPTPRPSRTGSGSGRRRSPVAGSATSPGPELPAGLIAAEQAQGHLVQPAVGAHHAAAVRAPVAGQVAEPAAGLLHDYL